MDKNKNDNLSKKYEWLNIITTIENYVEPEYYNKLLKPYIFNNKSDENLFNDYLAQIVAKKNNINKVLELGCGSGRITNIFLNVFKNNFAELQLVDLSQRMLKYSEEKFSKFNNISFFESDSIKFLEEATETYDLIFSLWSFSHSIHQILSDMGLKNGRPYIKKIIRKMVINNMKNGANFYLIHFDSQSDEQKILMQQWKKVYPIYKNTKQQSPSKLLLDDIFSELENEKIITNEQKHYIGTEIVYSNLNEALEIFFNFHMESYFNKSPQLEKAINEMTSYFKKFITKNGNIAIKPACFIYKLTKIS